MASLRDLSLLVFSTLALLPGCSDDAGGSDASGTESAGDGDGDSGDGDGDSGDGDAELPDLFEAQLLGSPSKVSCTLDNGAQTDCWELRFASKTTDMGPFCPATLADVGGLGIYDGETNPGFQVMKAELFEAMEADGWDIVDDQGNIRVIDDGMTMPTPGLAYCLALPARDLELTFLIPADPVMLDSSNQIDVVELFGVALDGVPLTGHPPSVVDGPPIPGAMGGNIPSLDPCGGHPDPAGYFHWHFAAEAMNSVLASYAIDELSCVNKAQKATGLVGFAKDGYPIYAPEQEGGGVPGDLDECNGKQGPTPEFPGGIYHYYAVDATAPNLPTCIRGASVANALSFQ